MSDIMLAARLKQERLRRGLTKGEVAEGASISRNTLADAEAGTRHPSPETLDKLCNFYNIDKREVLEEVYGGDPLDSAPQAEAGGGARRMHMWSKSIEDETPGPPPIIVKPTGPGPRRAFGKPLISIDRVIVPQEEVEKARRGQPATVLIEFTDGERHRVP